MPGSAEPGKPPASAEPHPIRRTPASTNATMAGRSATVMPWEEVSMSNTGPSTGPLTRTQPTAAAARPTANHLRRALEESENVLVTGQG
jgi:hypothetical protein